MSLRNQKPWPNQTATQIQAKEAEYPAGVRVVPPDSGQLYVYK